MNSSSTNLTTLSILLSSPLILVKVITNIDTNIVSIVETTGISTYLIDTYYFG